VAVGTADGSGDGVAAKVDEVGVSGASTAWIVRSQEVVRKATTAILPAIMLRNAGPRAATAPSPVYPPVSGGYRPLSSNNSA
jgi:hypothetical protein